MEEKQRKQKMNEVVDKLKRIPVEVIVTSLNLADAIEKYYLSPSGAISKEEFDEVLRLASEYRLSKSKYFTKPKRVFASKDV